MMNKYYLLLLLAFCLSGLNAQETEKIIEPESLAKKLTKDANTEREKLDALFFWIADNIEYDIETFNKLGQRYPSFDIEHISDKIEYEKKYNIEVSRMVLRKGKGICDGYARLFKTLCDHVNIECEVVEGVVKAPRATEPSPHAWNAVRLNRKWYLVDATWASGGLNLSQDLFKKELDSLYYLTPPEILIFDHFPDNEKWTLLQEEYTYDQFLNAPIRSSKVFSDGLLNFYPKNQLISPNCNGLFELTFDFKNAESVDNISITERTIVSKSDELNLKVTKENYDSLINVHPDLSLRIPKIEIVETRINGNRMEFLIKPLTDELRGILVYINSSFPTLEYDVEAKQDLK